MTQSDREDKNQAKNQTSSTVEPGQTSPGQTSPGQTSNDSALVSGLERLAFKLHDLGNRLLGFLK